MQEAHTELQKDTKYDVIAGSIGIPEAVVVQYHGDLHVIGGATNWTMRDAILRLKYTQDGDIKGQLAIIGMNRPVIFGKIEYDDGDSGNINRAIGTPDKELCNELNRRLKEAPDVVEARIIRTAGLDSGARLGITELIEKLLSAYHVAHPKTYIAISPEIGWLSGMIAPDANYFKIMASDDEKAAMTVWAVVDKIWISPRECKNPEIVLPVWPTIDDAIIAKMSLLSDTKCKTVREYVEAIILREHTLLDHMDAIEKYYIQVARDIHTFAKAVIPQDKNYD